MTDAFWIAIGSAAAIGYLTSMVVTAARALAQERDWMTRRDLGS